jgi:hypothetical protein
LERAGAIAAVTFLATFLVCAYVGCTSTVTPSIVAPTRASFSGNARNSGEIASTAAGRVVDGNLRARYNALIATYGAQYGLKADAGISRIVEGATPDQERWVIDRQHWALFLKMNIKAHSAIAPTK